MLPSSTVAAEALLQSRAIEINGDWERFIDFVYHRLQARNLPAAGAEFVERIRQGMFWVHE